MNSSMPACCASSTAYWMSGLSTTGSISFGMALVAGRDRAVSGAGVVTVRRGRGGGWAPAGGAGALRRAPPVRQQAVEIGLEQIGRRLVLHPALAPQRQQLGLRQLVQPAALERPAPDQAGHRAAVMVEAHADVVGLHLGRAAGRARFVPLAPRPDPAPRPGPPPR